MMNDDSVLPTLSVCMLVLIVGAWMYTVIQEREKSPVYRSMNPPPGYYGVGERPGVHPIDDWLTGTKEDRKIPEMPKKSWQK